MPDLPAQAGSMNYPEIVRYQADIVASIGPSRPGDMTDFRGLMAFMLRTMTSEETHIFEIERDLAMLMSITDNDGLDATAHLPYRYTFLDMDVDLTIRGSVKRVLGIHLIDDPRSTVGILALLFWREPDGRVNAGSYALGIDWRETESLTAEVYRDLIDSGREMEMPSRAEMLEDKAEMKAVRSMAQNFLDMLDSKDVRIAELPAQGDGSKRVRKGKMPLPPRSVVRMALPLRSYVAELKSGGAHSYNHAFWVRGHWRHYRAERYAASGLLGTKRWIWPYIKGKGILVRKKYQVEGPDRDQDRS